MKLACLSLLFCVLALACDDDGGTDPDLDAAPPVDARLQDGAAQVNCTPNADGCAEQDFEQICDPSQSVCVECLTESDCQSAASLGPRCELSDNSCRCSEHADCATNPGGAYCQPVAAACGCLTIDDCPPDSECKIEPYLGTGIRRCRPL